MGGVREDVLWSVPAGLLMRMWEDLREDKIKRRLCASQEADGLIFLLKWRSPLGGVGMGPRE